MQEIHSLSVAPKHLDAEGESKSLSDVNSHYGVDSHFSTCFL